MTGSRSATGWRDRLGLDVGGKITLIAPEGTDTAFGTLPRLKTYTIAALFNVGFYEYDNSFIYVPLARRRCSSACPMRSATSKSSSPMPTRPSRIGQRISAALGGRARMVDWQSANSSLVSAVEIERTVMFLILSLIILVAAFNIISGMIMMVKDKGRDIAILRTMGASRGMVLRIFMLSGASIGVVGTLAGLRSASCSPRTSRRSATSCRICCRSSCSPPRSISSPASRPSSTPARSPRWC